MLFEGDALAEYSDFYDYTKSYPEGENADPDEVVEIPDIDTGDYHLKLPSGATIGHRSLFVFYRYVFIIIFSKGPLPPSKQFFFIGSRDIKKIRCRNSCRTAELIIRDENITYANRCVCIVPHCNSTFYL